MKYLLALTFALAPLTGHAFNEGFIMGYMMGSSGDGETQKVPVDGAPCFVDFENSRGVKFSLNVRLIKTIQAEEIGPNYCKQCDGRWFCRCPLVSGSKVILVDDSIYRLLKTPPEIEKLVIQKCSNGKSN